jgi:hypothetical protein
MMFLVGNVVAELDHHKDLMTESGSVAAARHEGTTVATVYGTTARRNRIAT